MNEIKIFVVYLFLFITLTVLMVSTEDAATFLELWADSWAGKISVFLASTIPLFSLRFLYREQQQLKVRWHEDVEDG